MALFKLTVKRKFNVRQGKFADPGMTAEVTYNGSNFPIGDTKYRLELAWRKPDAILQNQPQAPAVG